jgi:dihydrofolate reductase
LPEDLQRFKRLTMGKPMVMGRKTYTSIGRPLPGRRNIVLTRDQSFTAPGIEVVHSLEDALEGLDGEVSVIGGGEIFALTLPMATRLELTLVNTVVEAADAFFPEWNESDWLEVNRVHHPADDRHAFSFDFVTLERRV